MACANVNCSQDYSLGESTAIILYCIDEEVFLSRNSPLYDPIRYQLVNPTPANYAAMYGSTIAINNIGLLAETFKFNFAKNQIQNRTLGGG